jgi:transcriptional regulator with XRE-family HTH domain
MTIQERLISLRRESGLSIRELSKLLGIPHSNYQRVEHKQPPCFSLLSRLSVFYGLTLSGLLKDVKPTI